MCGFFVRRYSPLTNREMMTNASLRERFGLEVTASAQMSRLIRDTQNSELIKPYNPNTAPKHMRYVPYWA
jgi:hypothetical protein